MYTITILTKTTTIYKQWQHEILISDLLKALAIPLPLPCSGRGLCGNCKIKVTGDVSLPNTAELEFLSEDERCLGIRLACFTKVHGNASIDLRYREISPRILSWAPLPESFQPSLKTESGQYPPTGLACDIGTTTVVVQLYDLSSGQLLATLSEFNRQAVYGADVISRIQACENGELQTLSSCIHNQLSHMATTCYEIYASSCGKDAKKNLKEVVITGNATMLHIYEGLSPASLAKSPFSLVSSFGCASGNPLLAAPTYLAPCIGPYVGGDAVCAALSSGILEEEAPSMLVDIGTNGEIMLKTKNHHLLCCSTAAGPAFEGACLSCGLPAQRGAIDSVFIGARGQIEYTTLEQTDAIGICGSGLLDAVAVLLALEEMDGSGRLEQPFRFPNSSVVLTQEDVRKIQVAKSAIYSGMITLLHHSGLWEDQIHRLYLAGGFGNHIHLHSAASIGLIPRSMGSKAIFKGNAALSGASMILLSPTLRHRAKAIASSAEEIPLACDSFFSKTFIDSMSFSF